MTIDILEEAAKARKLAARALMLVAYEEHFGIEDQIRQVYQPVYLDHDWDLMLLRVDIADIMNSLQS